ncbi:MAG: tail fiber domain-containing protein, partial [Planctomycetes bacterium]|nr:tail fiber domain-containing protein [Planctomycetota bacterium]
MLSGRQSGLAGLGLNAAQSQGGLEQMIAQLMGGRGAVEAGGITGAAEAEASGIIGELAYQDKRKQDSNKNRNDLLGLGLKALTSGLFSDPRLKKNIKKEGKIGPLDLISWEWIDKAKDTIVSKSNTFGFMSTQVKEHYPECVGEFGGFDIVDYGQLIGRLKCL